MTVVFLEESLTCSDNIVEKQDEELSLVYDAVGNGILEYVYTCIIYF